MSVDFHIYDSVKDTDGHPRHVEFIFNVANANAGRIGAAIGLDEYSDDRCTSQGGSCPADVALQCIREWRNPNPLDVYLTERVEELREALEGALIKHPERSLHLYWH